MVGKPQWVILCMLLITGLVIGNLGCSKPVPMTTVPTTTVPSTTGKVDALWVVAMLMYEGDWEGTFTYSEPKLDAEGKQVFEFVGNSGTTAYENPKDMKVSLTLERFARNEPYGMPGSAVRVVSLKITRVWVSHPVFGTGTNGIAPSSYSQVWLPTDPPTNASNPSQPGMGIQIKFPNGLSLQTNMTLAGNVAGLLDVTADGKTLSGTTWMVLDPAMLTQRFQYPEGPGKWRKDGWSLTNVSKPSIKGSVFCIPVGDIGKPLTTDVTDNPENAKVTISGLVSRMIEVDKEGAYLFSNLPKGSYKVTASARWYTSQTKTVEVSQGQVIVDKFILFRGYGTVKGRVLYKGQGLNEATVRVVNATTAVIAAADYTGKDGSYTFKVPAGQYLIISGPGANSNPISGVGPFQELVPLFEAYEKANSSITIEPNTVVTHDIVLSP